MGGVAGTSRPPHPPLSPSRADKSSRNYERATYTKSPFRPRTKGANFRGTTLVRIRHRRCRPHSGRLPTKALAITGEPEGAFPADAGSVPQLPGDVRRRALRGLAAGDPLLFSLNQVKPGRDSPGPLPRTPPDRRLFLFKLVRAVPAARSADGTAKQSMALPSIVIIPRAQTTVNHQTEISVCTDLVG